MNIARQVSQLMFLTLLLGGTVGSISLVFSAPAIALQPQAEWIPQFNPERQIYVNPVLQNSPLAPNLGQLEVALKNHDDFQVYLVVTTGEGEGNQAIARAAADQIATAWSSSHLFDSQRSLIIYWIIRTDMPGRGSVAANGGAVLQRAGVTAEWLSAPNGGVIPALRAHMPADPNGAFMTIVEGAEEKLWWSEFWAIAPGIISIAAGLALGSATVMRIIRLRRSSAPASMQENSTNDPDTDDPTSNQPSAKRPSSTNTVQQKTERKNRNPYGEHTQSVTTYSSYSSDDSSTSWSSHSYDSSSSDYSSSSGNSDLSSNSSTSWGSHSYDSSSSSSSDYSSSSGGSDYSSSSGGGDY